MEAQSEKRGPGRPPMVKPDMHPEDSRARAHARAQEIMDHLGTIDDSTDEFYVPASAIPDGWTWEWKRKSVFNQEDTANLNGRLAMGWEYVDASRYPDIHTEDRAGKNIVRKGLVLMERPEEVTQVFRNKDKKAADDQVRFKEEQVKGDPTGGRLGSGYAPDNAGKPLNKIKTEWQSLAVPK